MEFGGGWEKDRARRRALYHPSELGTMICRLSKKARHDEADIAYLPGQKKPKVKASLSYFRDLVSSQGRKKEQQKKRAKFGGTHL